MAVHDVTDIVSFYRELTNILDQFKEKSLSYDDAKVCIEVLNLKSEELCLGVLIASTVLNSIVEGPYVDEDDLVASEDPDEVYEDEESDDS